MSNTAPVALDATDLESATIEVGARLRQARISRGLSIQEVADRVGVSKSFVSRFERDVVNASVSTLLKLCAVLGVKPGTLFEPPVAKLVPADRRPPINLGGSHMREYLVGGGGNEQMMAIYSVVEPGGGSGDEPYTLDAAVDMVHVQTGTLSVTVGDQTYLLRTGDTLTFPPSVPHTWINPSDTEVSTALWVIVPPPASWH